MKRYGTNIFDGGYKKLKAHHTWPTLALSLEVPHEWLRKHCMKRLKEAVEDHGEFEFDLSKEPLEEMKGRCVIPWAVQQLVTD
jgi:hypothetical protein